MAGELVFPAANHNMVLKIRKQRSLKIVLNKKEAEKENGMLKKWIKRNYGERCLEYEKGCPCCDVWVLYDNLKIAED